ncbi:tetratricopeptide repeat protein [Povalibacter sp.]|uniref:tetratricopeptide repeat protein n=1 Tax=Povalibacter sp. TaxID=1962978 RepID=UPI002F42BFB5
MQRAALIVAVAALTFVAAIARADGPGAYRPVERPSSSTAPVLHAIDAYNAGYAQIRRADELGTQADAARQAKIAYQAALKEFSRAVQLDPAMHEAYTYIGYAKRQLSDYEAALDAYEKALRINPDYPPAIEYQGEAFVKLGRMDEAKFNYLRLYALSPPLAAKLLTSMQQRVGSNRSADTAELEAWMTERAALAAKAGNDRPGSSW